MQKENKEPGSVDIYQAMFGALESPGILPLVQAASELLHAPVVFTDEKYHLIALHPPTPVGDHVYDALLTNGKLPIETIVAFQQAYLDNPGKYYQPFYADQGLVADYPRIFAEVNNEKKIFGHVGILVGRTTVQPWQLEAASVLASALRIKMGMVNQTITSMAQSLVDLLDPASSYNKKELAVLNLHDRRHHPGLLIAAPMNKTIGQQAFTSVIINHLQHVYKGVIATVYQNDLVMLITSKTPDPTKQNFSKIANAIAALLSQYQIRCGAAGPIEDLHRLPDYFGQAHLTALLAEEKKSKAAISYYRDLAPAQFYKFVADSGMAGCFIHPLLPALREYDRLNTTELHGTLRCFCQYLFNKNQTSETMHIHRNTLLYRLKRIEDIFSINLEDPRVLHHLLLSFELSAHQEF